MALDSIGARGCEVLASLDVLIPMYADASGLLRVQLTLPDWVDVVDASLVAQMFVLDPNANAAQLAASNALLCNTGLDQAYLASSADLLEWLKKFLKGKGWKWAVKGIDIGKWIAKYGLKVFKAVKKCLEDPGLDDPKKFLECLDKELKECDGATFVDALADLIKIFVPADETIDKIKKAIKDCLEKHPNPFTQEFIDCLAKALDDAGLEPADGFTWKEIVDTIKDLLGSMK
jgi:hypothetical protein